MYVLYNIIGILLNIIHFSIHDTAIITMYIILIVPPIYLIFNLT